LAAAPEEEEELLMVELSPRAAEAARMAACVARGDFLDLTGESPPGACIDLTGEEEEPPLAARRATRRGKWWPS